MKLLKRLFGGGKTQSPSGQSQALREGVVVSPPQPKLTEWPKGDIHDAARNGDLEMVKALLERNPGLVFSKDDKGWTPLHRAANRGHNALAELLLANKADVNVKGYYGFTPLHEAAFNGNKDVVELLLANKANVNAKDDDGMTPLQLAMSEGYKDIAEFLRRHGCYGTTTTQATIHEAVKAGDLETVKALLKENPDLVFSEDKGTHCWTPLHRAAAYGHKNLAELLLANKAEVNAKDNKGKTPLHWAADNGNEDVAELLLANKAEVSVKNNSGVTPLYLAALHCRMGIVKILLANKAEVNAGDNWTPLHIAAKEGFKDVVELLLANKADVNSKDNEGGTPLHLAVQGDKKDVAELLLTNKAEVNQKNNAGITPLDVALTYGRKDVAELLRQHGGSSTKPVFANSRNELAANLEGWKSSGEPETWVQAHPQGWGHKDWLDLLATLCKSQYWPMDEVAIGKHLVMLRSKLTGDKTPTDTSIHDAVKKGDLETVKALLRSNSGLAYSKDNDSRTALHYAANYGRKDIAEVLISNGAVVNAKSASLRVTPLHIAAHSGSKEVVELLLDNIVTEIDIRNKQGDTPLLLASENGHKEIVQLLLGRKANVNLKADKGYTPLQAAAGKGHGDVVALLLANHAEVNDVDQFGDTALEIALRHSQEHVAELLRQHGGVKRKGNETWVAGPLTESGTQCIVCGAPMAKGGAPLTLSCAEGHDKISYYSFDSSYATLSFAIASILKSKGYRVEKSAESNHYNIYT
jgi:ankyrin repeat protein